ncbi:ABC transporter ATP-binding protein [soil metagenome]
MASVTLQAIAKSYGDVVALRSMDLETGDGEFVTLLGPSGCGKSTTLRLVAGFMKPSTGRILFGGEPVTHLPPQHRGIGMVFQDYALFPHMTIADNIGFGLTEARKPAKEIAERVAELLELIRLPDVGKRFPSELSGGQQQRVAVARAVAHSPRVLLMDEPLGALDLKLREAMQAEIRQIQKKLAITTIYVTHDQGEAMNLSDRIVVMNNGMIEQIGTADEIYDRPRSRFVADFVGQINLLDARPEGRDAEWDVLSVAGVSVKATSTPTNDGSRLTIGIRPEQISIAASGAPTPSGLNALPGTIVARRFVGNVIKMDVDIGNGETVIVDVHPNQVPSLVDTRVSVIWNPRHAVVLTA